MIDIAYRAKNLGLPGLFRLICVVLMMAFAAVGLVGCDSGPLASLFGTKPPFPAKSSGLIFGTRSFMTPIYWIDNDHALFPGYAVERKKDASGKEVVSGTPPGVYIWDIKNNTYMRHADLTEPIWFLCFNKSFVAYSIDSQGEDTRGPKLVVKAGMLGQETLLPKELFWKEHPELKQCHDPKAEVRPEHQGGGIDYLRAEDGYLYAGAAIASEGHFTINADNQNVPIKFYKPGRTEPINLPVLPKETFLVEKYSDYGHKYLIIPSRPKSRDFSSSDGSWPPDTPKPIYLLSSDGAVETVEIPAGPWVSMNAAYMTAKGIFIVSNNAVGANSRNAGGWLLHDGKVTKLFDQLVDGAGVSPDGCKIAYANNDFNPKTTEYVQVIDLCAHTTK